jgi:hypothetical protein
MLIHLGRCFSFFLSFVCLSFLILHLVLLSIVFHLFFILSFICFSFFLSFVFLSFLLLHLTLLSVFFCKKSFLILSSSLSQELILFIEYLFCVFFFIENLFCVLFICLYNPFAKIIDKTLLCTLPQKRVMQRNYIFLF